MGVDNHEGSVAARSRALFDQLRRRNRLPADAGEPAEDARGEQEPAVYDFAADDADAAEEVLPRSTGAVEGGPDRDADQPVGQFREDVGTPQLEGEGAADAPDEATDGVALPTPGGVQERGTEAGPAEVDEGPEPPLEHPQAEGPPPGPPGAATGAPPTPAGAAGAPSAPAGARPTAAAGNGTAPAPDAPDVSGRHPAADRPLPRIVAIANQKGGVGKTTTAVNLGAALAELGYRTLIVDLDPQGNATTGLGVNARNLEHAIYDVLMHELPIDECIEPTSVRNLFVAPATIDLAGAEIELVPAFSRELRLRKALAEVADDYDFTIIDCPPSLGLLTVNGLAAAGEVIVPIQCEYYALEGLSQLLRNVSLVQSNLNPSLSVSAIILTMYDARTKLADQVAGEVRQHFGAKVCRNVVPRTVRLSEAPSFGQPITVFDPASRGALAYRELAKEVSGGAPQRVG